LIWRRESIDVPGGESVIGRDRGCAVQIVADSVSRHHARLTVSGREASIEDLGSKNGTWVAGERIHGTVLLTDGVLSAGIRDRPLRDHHRRSSDENGRSLIGPPI
jgi:pSer/pThr/pTyr-binding forkhead associated (FHA) protein